LVGLQTLIIGKNGLVDILLLSVQNLMNCSCKGIKFKTGYMDFSFHANFEYRSKILMNEKNISLFP
jgi:hypothetical protein